ncbi:MAG: DUF3365 domain-containing protein [Chitinophagaceae bacterium]|nr:DUF3365 domain-containing protein [Chitinophagaceae bacterium]
MNKVIRFHNRFKKTIVIVLCIITIVACEKRRDPQSIKKENEEIHQKKVYKIQPFQITQTAEKIAKEITETYQQELMDTISFALRNLTPEAKQLCNIHSLQKTKQKAQQINASLKRIYHTNQSPTQNQNEKNITKAFLYSLQNNPKTESSLVFSQNNDTIYYLYPIKRETNTCIQCHRPHNNIQNTNSPTLSQNQTQNTKKPIGILIISFPKKEIIKQLIKDLY